MDVAQILTERLPLWWNYGVTNDGRIFFINEETRSTTWLHPRHKLAIQSGHFSTQDLPSGWELEFTEDNVPYFIDHERQITTFHNPVTGEHSMLKANFARSQEERKSKKDKQRTPKPPKKTKTIKETPASKRNFNAPISHEGWLYRPDSGKKTNWKKRWAVISDFCIYFYKERDEREESGALSLPSYVISPTDDVSRKYALKATHANMVTQYFAAENEKEQLTWIEALQQASRLEQPHRQTVNPTQGDDEAFGFDQGQRSPEGNMNRYGHRNSQRQPGGYDPRGPPYSPASSVSQHGSYHVRSSSQSDAYGRQGGGERPPYSLQSSGSHMGAPPPRGVSPSASSVQGSVASAARHPPPPHGGLPAARGYTPQPTPQMDHRNNTPQPTPQADHRGYPGAPPANPLRDPYASQPVHRPRDSRSSSSEGYSNNRYGYDTNTKQRGPDEGYGTMDNMLGSSGNTYGHPQQRGDHRPPSSLSGSLAHAPRATSDPRDARSGAYPAHPGSQPQPQGGSGRYTPQAQHRTPPSQQDPYSGHPSSSVPGGPPTHHPSADPHNRRDRYPGKRSPDPASRSQSQPQQRGWSSPQDYRSDAREQYRGEFSGDGHSASSASDSLRRAGPGYWQGEQRDGEVPVNGVSPNSSELSYSHGARDWQGRAAPASRQQPPGRDQEDSYFQPLTIDTNSAGGRSGGQGRGPPAGQPPPARGEHAAALLQTDGHQQSAPGRLPDHVQRAAAASTPLTRQDMLTSFNTSIQRQRHEPLVFQYPEDQPPSARSGGSSRQPSYQYGDQPPPQQQQQQQAPAQYSRQYPAQSDYGAPRGGPPPQPSPRQEGHSAGQQTGPGSQGGSRQPTPSMARQQQPAGYGPAAYSGGPGPQRPPSAQGSSRQHTPSMGRHTQPDRPGQYVSGAGNPASATNAYSRSPSHDAESSRWQETTAPDTPQQLGQPSGNKIELPPTPKGGRHMAPPGQLARLIMHDHGLLNAKHGRKQSAEDDSQYKRKSVSDNVRDLEDKEIQRLKKHIDASFKRLSLGSELGRRFLEEEDKNDPSSSFKHSRAASAGGDHRARHSLDWEMETSRHKSDFQQYMAPSDLSKQHEHQQHSTPMTEDMSRSRFDPSASSIQPVSQIQTQLGREADSSQYPPRFDGPGYDAYGQFQSNSNRNNNLIPSLTSGFSKFVSDSNKQQQPEHSRIGETPYTGSTNLSTNYGFEQTPQHWDEPHNQQQSFQITPPLRQSSYVENDDVTVIEMPAPHDDGPSIERAPEQMMEEIGKDVRNIKARINSLRSLMEAEIAEERNATLVSEKPFTSDDITPSLSARNYENLKHLDPDPIKMDDDTFARSVKDAADRYFSTQAAGLKNITSPTRSGNRDDSMLRRDTPQRHSYAGRHLDQELDSLPSRHSIAHYGGPTSPGDSYMDQYRQERFPGPTQQGNEYRDSGYDYPRRPETQGMHPGAYSEPQAHQTSSYSSQSSLRAGLPPSGRPMQRDSYASQGSLGGTLQKERQRNSYSSQSSYRAQERSPNMVSQHLPTGELHDPRPVQNVDPYVRSSTLPSASPQPYQVQHASPRAGTFRNEGYGSSTRITRSPVSSPFKHLIPSSGGKPLGTRDDSALFDRPHGDTATGALNRPKSYAGGMVGAPLTKLEKLEMENNISKSMGALNILDLEETAAILTGQAPAVGYDGEWGSQHGQHATDTSYHQPPSHQSPPHEQPYSGYSAYEREGGAPPVPPKSPGVGRRPPQLMSGQTFEIGAIKEDPDMADDQVLDDKKLSRLKQSLDSHRLRLSISANDLIGKSHEELVLLLIQLKRSQARLENERDYFRARLDQSRPGEREYKLKRKNSGRQEDWAEQEHAEYNELRRQMDDIENQLEVHKPLINLVDNIVTMGSLYGGDNLMLASQYKKHKLRPDQYIAPKEMIEFSRAHQERRLVEAQEEDLRKLTEEEIELEEKLNQLFELDRALQEKSINVTNLQEDKELLEKAMQSLLQTIEWETDPREQRNLQLKKQSLQEELSALRQRLADASKDLEETTAENAKVEHEVILLRKKVYGLNKSHSTPNLTTESMKSRMKMERELDKVSALMSGLSQQGEQLQQSIQALTKSNPDLTTSPKPPKFSGDSIRREKKKFTETDLDSMTSQNLAKSSPASVHRYDDVRSAGHSRNSSYVASSQPSPGFNPPYTSTMDRPVERSHSANKYDLNQNSVYSGRGDSSLNSGIDSQGYHTRSYPQHSHQSSVGSSQQDIYGTARSDASRHRFASDRDLHNSSRDAPSLQHGSSLEGGQDGLFQAKRIYVQSPAASRKTLPVTQVQPQHNGYSQGDLSSDSFGRYNASQPVASKASTNSSSGSGAGSSSKTLTLRDLKKRRESERERKSREHEQPASPGDTDSESDAAIRAPSDELSERSSAAGDTGSHSRSQSLPRRSPLSDDSSGKNFNDMVRRPRRKQMDPERRKSAMERLFTPLDSSQDASTLSNPSHASGLVTAAHPSAQGTLPATSAPPRAPVAQPINLNSEARLKSMTNLFTPKPFGASGRTSSSTIRPVSSGVATAPTSLQPSTAGPVLSAASPGREEPREGEPHDVEDEMPAKPQVTFAAPRVSPLTVATVRPQQQQQPAAQQSHTWRPSNTATVRPQPATTDKQRKAPKSVLKNRRGDPRRQTISSSQPAWLETSPPKRTHLQTAAGDLISVKPNADFKAPVKSSSVTELNFDDDTIDRFVLGAPDKVLIPERYVPESDDESVTEEELLTRQEKTATIRKMVVQQSLQEWHSGELGVRAGGDVHRALASEAQHRERMLDIRQALAREVTAVSKQQAVHMRERSGQAESEL